MNREQAKEILKMYRPTADAGDPSFAEALELCAHDAELREWFDNHCAVYAALRNRFGDIAVPDGLKQQILAERPTRTRPSWQRAAAGTAAIAIILTLVALPFVSRWQRERAAYRFPAFLNRTASIALRNYSMDLVTDDLDQIRNFLRQRNSIGDYALPENLEKNARPVGCVATVWHGKPVAMICFRSGKPLPSDQASDLWLFVIDRNSAVGTPAPGNQQIVKVNRLTAATWTDGERTYVLASDEDEEELKKFL